MHKVFVDIYLFLVIK